MPNFRDLGQKCHFFANKSEDLVEARNLAQW